MPLWAALHNKGASRHSPAKLHVPWLTQEECRALTASPEEMAKVREELAHILIHMVQLTDKLGIDLEQATLAKIETNVERYLVEKARGTATK